MRYYDESEAAELNAEQWQLDLLKLNPDYLGWGPHEDYMFVEGESWESRVIKASWKEFNWKLDELNECVNFYFSVARASEQCRMCSGCGVVGNQFDTVWCPECSGDGTVYTAPTAHVTLTLWMLHPRKGCSRGVEVSLIERDDLPAVFAWLRQAAERNAKRFSALPAAQP